MDLHPVLSGPISELLPGILDSLKPSKVFILVDEHTAEHCLPVLTKVSLLGADSQYLANLPKEQIITFPAGELNKTLKTVSDVWNQLIEQKADRQALLINLGGGVVTDLGGYAAGCYKRGIRFIHIPTTVLGMVDAALGGKTGIDHAGIKNSVGLFKMPEVVLTDVQFLTTLPARELRSGMAEMYKHALIQDKAHWDELKLKPDLTADLIANSQQVKLEIVEKDPYEQGIRAALNFGHSIGHAIESLLLSTAAPLLHGEAIAVGMICEAYLSERLCGLAKEAVLDIEKTLLLVYGHISLTNRQRESIVSLVANDKKNLRGTIRMSLLHKIGSPALSIQVNDSEINEAVGRYLALR